MNVMRKREEKNGLSESGKEWSQIDKEWSQIDTYTRTKISRRRR